MNGSLTNEAALATMMLCLSLGGLLAQKPSAAKAGEGSKTQELALVWSDEFDSYHPRWNWKYSAGSGFKKVADGMLHAGITDKSSSQVYSDNSLHESRLSHQEAIVEMRLRCSDDNKLVSKIGEGTRGWGFWTGAKAPAQLNVAWFLSASPESDPQMSGFRAQVIRKGAFLLNQPVSVDMREWHTYRVEMRSSGTRFLVDGKEVASCNGSPTGRHRATIWIDNYRVYEVKLGGKAPDYQTSYLDVHQNQEMWVDWVRLFAARAAGPRGPVGPDVPLTPAEQARFAKRVTAEGRTAAVAQAACERAAREGIQAVFLPAGEYVFDAEVRVPGGLTLLGEGSKTLIRAKARDTHLLSADGDGVRFTRLKLQGANATPSTDNDSYGISVSGRKNARIDHCELFGFSYATSFSSEATAQIDHCSIHHNLRDGLGYGVALYSGAYVLVCDNEFSQNRHSLASNGALDWSSPKRLGKYVHKPGVRKTHWEFLHNRVGSNDKSPYELCAVDTHPGMDGTFVVEHNVFENLRHGVGIRDGSGLIQGNAFRDLRTRTTFRPLVAVSISYGTHNNIPVESCMPHGIEVKDNVFEMKEGVKYEPCSVGKAENITVDGKLIPETKTDRPAPPIPRLEPMGEDGILRWQQEDRQ